MLQHHLQSLINHIKYANSQAPEKNYVGIDINDPFSKHWEPEPSLEYRVDDVRARGRRSLGQPGIGVLTGWPSNDRRELAPGRATVQPGKHSPRAETSLLQVPAWRPTMTVGSC